MNALMAWTGQTLLALTLASTTQADVLRVGGATPDHGSIASAVAAAQDGDTLLVYATGLTQAPVLIDGKALTIVADVPARILLANSIEVRNLTSGQTVVLEGFDVGTPSGFLIDGPALSIRFCQGAVRVDDCSFRGRTPLVCELPQDGYPGVYVTQATDVAFSDCDILGGDGKPTDENEDCGPSQAQFYLGIGGPGCFVRNSSVALVDCRVTGGEGGYPDEFDGEAGGIGLEVRDGYVFLADCTVTGGDGTDGWPFLPIEGCGGDGGHGLELATSNASVEFFQTTFTGGTEGSGSFDGQPWPGAPGLDTSLAPGSVLIDLAVVARKMTIAAPIRAGQPTPFHFEGQPGDKVFAMLSAQPAFLLPFPQAAGPKLVGALIRRLPLGTIDATGQLDVQLATPPLPPGSENLTWYWQGLFVGTDGQAVVGPTEPWIIVDAGF